MEAISSKCLASDHRSQALNHTHFRSGNTSQKPFRLPPQAPLRMCFGHWDSGHRNATCWIAQSPQRLQSSKRALTGSSSDCTKSRPAGHLSTRRAIKRRTEANFASELKKRSWAALRKQKCALLKKEISPYRERPTELPAVFPPAGRRSIFWVGAKSFMKSCQ